MDESGELDKNELTKWSEKIEKQYIEKDVAEWVWLFQDFSEIQIKPLGANIRQHSLVAPRYDSHGYTPTIYLD